MTDVGSAPRPRSENRRSKPNGNTDPNKDLLQALQAMRAGDFSVRMRGDYLGIEGKIADAFNEIVAANQRMAQQLDRVGQVVGREGQDPAARQFGLAAARGQTWKARSTR